MAIAKKLFNVRGVLSRKSAPMVLNNRHNHSKPLIAWSNEVESRARHEMEEKLDREHRKLVDIYGRGSLYALPHVLTGYQVDALRRLQEALYFALTAIVANYSRDSRIQSTYEFEPKIKSLLNLYDGFPYRNVGSYRPDFLHEKHSMKPRLCEINARFVLNGYIISELGTSIILGLDSIKPWQAELSFTTPMSTRVLASLKNEFDLSKPIGLLKNREHGYDVNLFKSMVPEAYFIRPEELRLNKNGKLVFKQQEKNEIEIDQFLVELHQDEIISLPFDIQKALVKSSKLFNDLRTVFIGHDKRFLTLLSRDEVLADYLSPKHHELIKSHRIRSVTSKEVIENRRLREEISENRGKWLLKPCLLGKGEGIRFGKDVASGKEWSNLIEKAASNYIFQEYIDQHKFDLTNRPGLNLIGTMLCLNEKFLGLGIYRAGREDLISLSKGGFFAFPAALKSTLDQNDESTIHRELIVPKEAQFHLSTYSFKDVESYKRELTENGLVIIDLDLDDEKKSDFFINLVRCLDMQPNAHTKKGDDFIWDIKPKLATTNSGPRSHRSDVFNMHTDASFEEQPPRFFGLLVLQADRYGAGHTLLIRLEDILDRLEADEIECLQSEQVEIEIPVEFRRNDHTKMIKGPILSPRRDLFGHMLIRYRADLIVDKKRQSSRFQATLAKLEKLIDLKGDLVQQTRLKPNQLLLVDNGRWLHGRSKIFDMERHLLRVRFQTKSKFMLPWEKTF